MTQTVSSLFFVDSTKDMEKKKFLRHATNNKGPKDITCECRFARLSIMCRPKTGSSTDFRCLLHAWIIHSSVLNGLTIKQTIKQTNTFPLKMVGCKDLTEYEGKSSQCSKNNFKRSLESLKNYCSRPLQKQERHEEWFNFADYCIELLKII